MQRFCSRNDITPEGGRHRSQALPALLSAWSVCTNGADGIHRCCPARWDPDRQGGHTRQHERDGHERQGIEGVAAVEHPADQLRGPERQGEPDAAAHGDHRQALAHDEPNDLATVGDGLAAMAVLDAARHAPTTPALVS